MLLQYASDLHLEFPENSRFMAEHPIQPVGDVLVLAGDIDCLNQEGYPAHPFWDWVSEKFAHVLVVPGNHEFYGGFDVKRMEHEHCFAIRENVFLCHNYTMQISGIDFIMTTLWSHIQPNSAQTIERFVSDYRLINYDGQRLNTAISNRLHADCLDYLKQEFSKPKTRKRVVVTHHVPSLVGLSAEFEGSILNDAFVSNLDRWIVESNADAWIYGHSHRNRQAFQIGQTRLVTNQLGYVRQNEHITYNTSCMIRL